MIIGPLINDSIITRIIYANPIRVCFYGRFTSKPIVSSTLRITYFVSRMSYHLLSVWVCVYVSHTSIYDLNVTLLLTYQNSTN